MVVQPMYQVCIDSYGSVLDLQVGAMLFAWYVICLVFLFLSNEGLLVENCFAFYILFLFYMIYMNSGYTCIVALFVID